MRAEHWRLARIGDLPAVERMHDEQEALLGEAVDRPALHEKPVLVALVLDDNGKLPGGFYFEAIAEMCFMGVDPEVTADAQMIAPAMYSFLKKRGIRWLRCFIPRKLDTVLGPRLKKAGFVNQDEKYCHYAVDLREAKDGTRR